MESTYLTNFLFFQKISLDSPPLGNDLEGISNLLKIGSILEYGLSGDQINDSIRFYSLNLIQNSGKLKSKKFEFIVPDKSSIKELFNFEGPYFYSKKNKFRRNLFFLNWGFWSHKS